MLVWNVTNIRSDRTNESIFFKRMKGEIILFYQQIMYHIEKQLIGVQNVYISIKETVMKFKNHFNLLNLQRNKSNNNNNNNNNVIIIVIIMKYRLILQMMYQQHDLDYKHVGVTIIWMDRCWFNTCYCYWWCMVTWTAYSVESNVNKNIRISWRWGTKGWIS